MFVCVGGGLFVLKKIYCLRLFDLTRFIVRNEILKRTCFHDSSSTYKGETNGSFKSVATYYC